MQVISVKLVKVELGGTVDIMVKKGNQFYGL